MCRQCIVEVDTGRGPQLQPSCMVTVAPDMVVETQSPTAKRVQEGMIEMLLANHPLDCPVCDKGGECPLQDQAYSTARARAVSSSRSGTTRSRSRSATTCSSIENDASCAIGAPALPTRWPATS